MGRKEGHGVSSSDSESKINKLKMFEDQYYEHLKKVGDPFDKETKSRLNLHVMKLKNKISGFGTLNDRLRNQQLQFLNQPFSQPIM